MKRNDIEKRLEELEVYNTDDEFPVVITTYNGVYVKGRKDKILTAITMLLHSFYKDGEFTKDEINEVVKLSTIDMNNMDDIIDLLKDLKERIGE